MGSDPVCLIFYTNLSIWGINSKTTPAAKLYIYFFFLITSAIVG
jgi:hypothetical protein